MHTPLITNPLLGNNAGKPAAKPQAGAAADLPFQQALSRQMTQRQASAPKPAVTPAPAQAKAPEQQQAAPPARPAAAPKPAQQGAPAAPKPAAQKTDNAAAQPEPAAQGTQAADAAQAAQAAADAPQGEAATAAAAAAAAEDDAAALLSGSVEDMLALVASLNQQPQVVATAVAVAATPAPAADSETGALGAGAGTALPDGATAFATPSGSATASGATPADAALAGAAADADAAAAAAGADPAATSATSARQAAALGADGKPAADAAATPPGGQFKLPETVARDAEPLRAQAPAPAVVAPAAQAQLATAQAASAVASSQLQARVGSSAWDQQLGQKVVWMVAGGEQSATMTLNPPDLGPLQVVLNVSNDQASASFTSAQPEVRAALEAALPKLRDMMSEAGIQLGEATVSAGMSDQNNGFDQARSAQQGGGNGRGGRFGHDQGGADAQAMPLPAPRQQPRGMVDIFA